MKNSIEIRCSADRTAVIDIEGTIGVEPAATDSRSVATYEAFNRALDHIRALDVDLITVNIRSLVTDPETTLVVNMDTINGFFKKGKLSFQSRKTRLILFHKR